MKTLLVKNLLIVLTISFFNGCWWDSSNLNVGIEKPKIPYTTPPVYDNTIYTKPSDIAAKIEKNINKQKDYNKKLLKAQEIYQ